MYHATSASYLSRQRGDSAGSMSQLGQQETLNGHVTRSSEPGVPMYLLARLTTPVDAIVEEDDTAVNTPCLAAGSTDDSEDMQFYNNAKT